METIDRIREYYNLIENQVLPDSMLVERAMIVNWVEKETGQDFKNTEDFRDKMECFLANQEKAGEKLKKARERKGWSQEILGHYVGVSQSECGKMERGEKPLNNKAVKFITPDKN